MLLAATLVGCGTDAVNRGDPSSSDASIAVDALGRPIESPMDLAPDVQLWPLTKEVIRHRTLHQIEDGRWIPANGLLVAVDEKSAVLIDTGWNYVQTEMLLRWSEKIWGRPVVAVIVSHTHEDNMGGIEAARERDLRIISSPLAQFIAKELDLPLPYPDGDLDFPEGPEAYAYPEYQLEIFWPGPGHAPANTVVWIPQQKILFGGCLIRSSGAMDLGNLDDADLVNWPLAVLEVADRYPDAKLVVPGHGSVGGPELIDRTLDLLTVAEIAEDSDS